MAVSGSEGIPWKILIPFGLFVGAILAVATGFGVPLELMVLLVVALFFIGVVVTLLNPMVRILFFMFGTIALGYTIAAGVWRYLFLGG